MKIGILISLVANGTQYPNIWPVRICSSQTLCQQEVRLEKDAIAKLGTADINTFRCISGPLMNHVYDPAKDTDADLDTRALKDHSLDYLKTRRKVL